MLVFLNHCQKYLVLLVNHFGMYYKQNVNISKDLQNFADGAEHGFIVFTLGSNALVSNMPEKIKLMFIRVFARIPQRV